MTAYPAPPGVKMAYDVDGSAGFVNVGTLRSLTQSELNVLNAESGTTVTRSGDNTNSYIGIIFPAVRDIVAMYHGFTFSGNTSGQSKTFQTSVDSTNGNDGTWVTQTASVTQGSDFRSTLTTYVLTGIKAVRWNIVTGQSFAAIQFNNMHIYQAAPAADTADRLRLWHPTLNSELVAAYFDEGDVMRTAVVDRTFRIKNNSATLTANNVLLTVSALTDASPTVVSQLTWDHPASPGTFTNPSNVATSIAPGALTGIITLRLTALSTAALDKWRQRIRAAATTWS